MGKMKNAYKIVVVKYDGKRPGHKWEGNIKMVLR
jgi:hypothetical protein